MITPQMIFERFFIDALALIAGMAVGYVIVLVVREYLTNKDDW